MATAWEQDDDMTQRLTRAENLQRQQRMITWRDYGCDSTLDGRLLVKEFGYNGYNIHPDFVESDREMRKRIKSIRELIDMITSFKVDMIKILRAKDDNTFEENYEVTIKRFSKWIPTCKKDAMAELAIHVPPLEVAGCGEWIRRLTRAFQEDYTLLAELSFELRKEFWEEDYRNFSVLEESMCTTERDYFQEKGINVRKRPEVPQIEQQAEPEEREQTRENSSRPSFQDLPYTFQNYTGAGIGPSPPTTPFIGFTESRSDRWAGVLERGRQVRRTISEGIQSILRTTRSTEEIRAPGLDPTASLQFQSDYARGIQQSVANMRALRGDRQDRRTTFPIGIIGPREADNADQDGDPNTSWQLFAANRAPGVVTFDRPPAAAAENVAPLTAAAIAEGQNPVDGRANPAGPEQPPTRPITAGDAAATSWGTIGEQERRQTSTPTRDNDEPILNPDMTRITGGNNSGPAATNGSQQQLHAIDEGAEVQQGALGP